ncbi:hypothetical protein Zmor_020596 [Zophobas morio]|uniref:Glutamine amidotransferase type-2 domain-containing protein n=1 Tax=Zophobas morio TaxID=2755281 RepID=A0AA38I7R9_9CUCU|nr:hypothetical protein Zmor_020596 [Zophobas morio]
MCGIFCMICSNKKCNLEYVINEFKLFEESVARRGPNSSHSEFFSLETSKLLLAASVLWLQGPGITKQPLTSNNSTLLYNGDIYGGPQVDDELRNKEGDTKLFLNLLERSSNITETVYNIEGPFAFVYFNESENLLYFGRDKYGRRSLLIGKDESDLIITSVAKRNTKYNFIELPSVGVFCIDLTTKNWQIFPWRRKSKHFYDKLNELEAFLEQSILKQEVDNEELKEFHPPNESQLEFLDNLLKMPSEEIFHYLSNSIYPDRIKKLKELLESSIKKRILTQPKFCQNCFKQFNCNHAVTGVLFSGGVDCAILALLANKFVDETRPIDLMNVAFEKNGTYDTPDRKTGRDTLQELQTLCSERTWNFVEINVTSKELDFYRKERISDLIYPLNSILDDSLGCALWFASKAATENYTSPCRARMGADELFGGYTRHRAAFQKKGWKELDEVLKEDWQNLPHRNLARDDRVVSDHGRQLRTPYLDEEVVKFTQNLNSWDKTYPTKDLPSGIGEKLLLRCLAYDLGLKNAATFKKRALQFGSRIANSKEKGHETSDRLQVK